MQQLESRRGASAVPMPSMTSMPEMSRGPMPPMSNRDRSGNMAAAAAAVATGSDPSYASAKLTAGYALADAFDAPAGPPGAQPRPMMPVGITEGGAQPPFQMGFAGDHRESVHSAAPVAPVASLPTTQRPLNQRPMLSAPLPPSPPSFAPPPSSSGTPNYALIALIVLSLIIIFLLIQLLMRINRAIRF